MKLKKGTIMMWMGTALLLAALALFCYNTMEDRSAGATAQATVTQLLAVIPETPQRKSVSDPYDTPEREMEKITLDGLDYIGLLTIPGQGLELPIAAAWDDETLKAAPCRYSGSLEGNDLVLCGHNYRRHFGRLENLRIGDAVLFTTVEGNRLSYQVSSIEAVQPTDMESMVLSGYPLTLFTCTYSGQTRLAIRCEKSI